jgi:predicted amidohydrolase
MKIAVLQLNSQGLSSTKLYNYIRIAHKKDIKVLVLGEYILNPFFKELKNLSLDMINESFKIQSKVLKESARDYDITIIAPMVLVKNKKPYKVIVKFSPKSISYYYQQLLINYSHWNEEKFFANPIEKLKSPLAFKVENIKFAIMAGFEIHFDKLWEFINQKHIDVVLIPSVSTFGSFSRWEAIAKTRAFTHNCYVLRANRIGSYKDKEVSWDFYGDSFLISPNAELLNHLGDEEELMICEVSHKEVIKAKRIWKFYEAIHKRNLV